MISRRNEWWMSVFGYGWLFSMISFYWCSVMVLVFTFSMYDCCFSPLDCLEMWSHGDPRWELWSRGQMNGGWMSCENGGCFCSLRRLIYIGRWSLSRGTCMVDEILLPSSRAHVLRILSVDSIVGGNPPYKVPRDRSLQRFRHVAHYGAVWLRGIIAVLTWSSGSWLKILWGKKNFLKK